MENFRSSQEDDEVGLVPFAERVELSSFPRTCTNSTTMDYEQDEQEEQFEEQAAEPQAEDMEIDEDDAPYLDLRDDRERQSCAMIKNRSFGHTRAFDLDLLEKTGMDVDFARV